MGRDYTGRFQALYGIEPWIVELAEVFADNMAKGIIEGAS
jgi:hypothetical protein